MYAVTLPGFGGTPAPPMPVAGTSYGGQTWTNGAVGGIKRLIVREALDRPVIVVSSGIREDGQRRSNLLFQVLDGPGHLGSRLLERNPVHDRVGAGVGAECDTVPGEGAQRVPAEHSWQRSVLAQVPADAVDLFHGLPVG